MTEVIKVDKLCKTYVIRKTFPGIFGAFRSLFCSQKQKVIAINEISFSIKAGEKVAFIGPNGAGKSTAIKMLTSILYPTSGLVEVLNFVPWKDRYSLGFKIGTVFGQKTQLWHNLPPLDSFFLLSKIYEINRSEYESHLKELIEMFEIGHFLNKPVRQLSLGERMRCELVASLLHKPQILFLDEPTIGLDINAKLKIRGFLNKLSKDYGMTLFLSSHDTADIEQICQRVIVLDKGTIILDNSLNELKQTYVKKKIITLTTDAEHFALNIAGVKVLKNGKYHFVCEVNLEEVSIDRVIHETLKQRSLNDMTIEDPSMEEIIRTLYATAGYD